ncbi:MAG: glycosyltransferase [Candidatus Omnitrophica bacterium]|nr:glycosyltransferase [Candidatus Omnitrophota bacterium]
MLDSPTFSVATFTFNRNEDLNRCLEALSRQTYSDFSIVVVNGGDLEGVQREVNKFPGLRVKIINQDRKGLVEARNLGWIHSKADIVCLIDDDLVVAPDWLENIRDTFLSDEHIGGVSGPTLIPPERQNNRDLALFLGEFSKGGNILFWLVGKLYLSLVLENKTRQVGMILRSGAFTPGSNYSFCTELPGIREVDYLEACHMCFRRNLLEELGGFDYQYTGTSEWSEPDFSFRVRKNGRRLVFNPRALTWHYISQGGVFKARTNSYERSRNFILFYMRWVKPDSPQKILRFSTNLIFINMYWVYKFLQTHNPDWLKGIAGTFDGLLGVKNPSC